MIAQVDDAVRSIIRSEVLQGRTVDLVFDAPTKDWAARRNAPTVNVYLYDIREDLRRRERGWLDQRSDDGTLTGRRPAPKFFKLSYLVTAWTQRPEDEHRLLDSLLRSLLLYEALPRSMVTGPLAETGLEVPVTVGLPPPEDRAFADVWSALGGELKPSLDLVVTAPVDTGVIYPVGPPVTDGVHVDMSDLVDGGRDEDRHRHHPGSEPLGVRAEAGAGRPRAARARKKR